MERKEAPQTCFPCKLSANSQHQLISHEMSGPGSGSTSHSQTIPIDIMWEEKKKNHPYQALPKLQIVSKMKSVVLNL